MKSIIVLGMHRSGTSAVTRAIGQLGAEMGPASRMRKHWENLPLRHFNDKILDLGNGSWDAPPPPNWLNKPKVRALVPEAKELIAAQFGNAEIAVWKDPRTCVTMPFWFKVFDEDPVFLLIYRHPSEVAASLTSRNSFTNGHSYAIWERYNADALRAVNGRPTVVLEYSHLVAEPVAALEQIRSAFANAGVVLPNDPATADHGLVAQERHHSAATPDALDDIATPSQHAMFAAFRSLEGAHDALQVPELPDMHPLSVQMLQLASQLRRAKRIRKATNAKEATETKAAGRAERAATGATPATTDAAASDAARRAERRAAAKAAPPGSGRRRSNTAAGDATDVDARRERRRARQAGPAKTAATATTSAPSEPLAPSAPAAAPSAGHAG